MEAIRVHEHGGPEVMRLDTLPAPAPGPGEAVVRLDTSGVNFFDIRQRTGDYPVQLPVTLGNEGAGVIEALGPDAGDNGMRVGQRVAYQMYQGSYATHALVPVDVLVPLPDAIDTRLAAAVLMQGLTAHALACSAYPVRTGETVVVHAAAGGLGGLLTQIATARGARVIGTVSRSAKAARARDAGAQDVIVSTEEDFPDAVRRLTAGRGADVVFDSVGKETFPGSLACLRPHGYLMLFGQASGAVPALDPHLLAKDGGRYLTYCTSGQYITDRADLLARAGELLGWVADGSLRVHVADTFPLADAAKAHEALASRAIAGKLLLEIG
jgi:NADPH2:quinone reductase